MVMGKKSSTEYTIQSVDNAIGILELLGSMEHEQSIQEIASALELTKSNANNLLATLHQLGYVETNPHTGNFRLGVRTFQISQRYINKLSIQEAGRTIIRDLRDRLNESVYLNVDRGQNTVCIDMAPTASAVHVDYSMGFVAPSYVSSCGKILLAYLDEETVRGYFPEKLQKYTKNTVGSMDSLIASLEEVKKQGYCISKEEYWDGVTSVAVPVRNFMNSVIASMSVSVPVYRVDDERIRQEIVPELLSSAHKLSVKYGYAE